LERKLELTIPTVKIIAGNHLVTEYDANHYEPMSPPLQTKRRRRRKT
jgi:hypothetical protein